MTNPQNFMNHLTKLTVATATARDLGYVHTARALDRMAEIEKSRLRSSRQVLRDNPAPSAQTSEVF